VRQFDVLGLLDRPTTAGLDRELVQRHGDEGGLLDLLLGGRPDIAGASGDQRVDHRVIGGGRLVRIGHRATGTEHDA